MGVIRFINNLICALGCITVALTMAVLMWLPTRTFARLQINLTADSQPIFLNVTGYEALMMANGLATFPAKIAALTGELQKQPGGEHLIAQYDIGAQQQVYIRDLAAQTESLPGLVMPFQVALFALPALTLLMAVIVAFSRGYFGEQLIKGVTLIALTLMACVVVAGSMLYLSERLNAVINASLAQNAAGFPGLGVSVNDKLPEMRIGVINLIDTRTPVIASGVGLIGAVVAMFGAALAARKPGLTPRQIAQAAMLQAQVAANNVPITPNPYPAPVAGAPIQPTQRLNPEPPSPAATLPPAAPSPAPASVSPASVPAPEPVKPAPAVATSLAPQQAPTPKVSPPPATTPSPAVPSSPSPTLRRICPTCGAPILGTEKFCRSCGSRLPPT
ncbi:MAG: zinc ribbon domain-containing protein [Thermoflexales bacterium]|nr:zinc ribbon domain-containing protein [Thermoflexales bacterium]MDW8350722.1 zinc ribbon domain-containing protein [Anaerolineae bacterium]